MVYVRMFRTDYSEPGNWSFIQQPLTESFLCARHRTGMGGPVVNKTKIPVQVRASFQ